jgi:hypothetical protein
MHIAKCCESARPFLSVCSRFPFFSFFEEHDGVLSIAQRQQLASEFSMARNKDVSAKSNTFRADHAVVTERRIMIKIANMKTKLRVAAEPLSAVAVANALHASLVDDISHHSEFQKKAASRRGIVRGRTVGEIRHVHLRRCWRVPTSWQRHSTSSALLVSPPASNLAIATLCVIKSCCHR